ncbi:MAG TPA: ECF-type sigma factor [Thermoanaerobaculia bacterium]|nr:ECF-type sigma factor [Thermoanaerobaculia bacterium]
MSSEITVWLARLGEGEKEALERLIPLLYDELRRVARQRRLGERSDHTLGTTALVHETYLRLLDQRQIRAADRQEFLAVAAATMRRVLVDYARARCRQKRGGGESPLPLDEAEPLLAVQEAEELVALNDALERLSALHPRGALVVEQRFFGGLSLEETAGLLGVSTKTVQRDWEAARAWLRKEVAAAL